MIELKFANPTARNLGEAFGMPMERQNELSDKLDEMVEHFSPKHGQREVFVSQIIEYIQGFCQTNEEFIYCLMNHIAWHHRRGSAVKPSYP